MALSHKNCRGQLYHSWKNSHKWTNEKGKTFELGSWWCYECSKEILSQKEMGLTKNPT